VKKYVWGLLESKDRAKVCSHEPHLPTLILEKGTKIQEKNILERHGMFLHMHLEVIDPLKRL
jgi:hypothetical protein